LIQLPPGGGIHVELASGSVEEFRWLDRPHSDPYRGSFAEATQEVRETFIESVRLHLKSDVRVGCALSGGIDSSAIACTMRLLLGKSGHIHAVSHIAHESAYSEERWIDLAASAANAVVHKVRPQPSDLPGDIDDLVRSQGEPISGTSLYAQYRVFAKAREAGLTVMLDGQGADELLAGYPYFKAYLARERLAEGAWVDAWRTLEGGNARGGFPPLGMPMLTARTFLPVRLSDQLGAAVGRPALPPWICLQDSDGYYREQERHRRARALGLHAALQDSMQTSLQGLLRYEDRNSMRFSIESRVPFLERKLVALLHRMPPAFLIGPSGQTKYVFREAMRGVVPNAILDRTDKVGFENDEARWLFECRPWVEVVLASAEIAAPLVDPLLLRGAWRSFVAKPTTPAARRLWATLLFLRWRQLMESVQ
jgi:asparagine synthase (glutamine-hydrolysing)